MRKTVFNQLHKQLGAKMVPFAGFELPVEYSGITNEHLAVRNSAGMFDVSHMGEFWVKGPRALSFLQKITTNNVETLKVGQVQYTCMPNDKGGIVDDLLVYHYEEEKYMMVVNGANIDKDWQWCQDQNTMGAELENSSDAISLLAVQGPRAKSILQKLTSVDLDGVPYYSFVVGDFADKNQIIISNTGYTGAGGFELYMYNSDGPAIWEAIMEAGEAEGLVPAGLGARDTLRLEMGFCLYGNDIDDTTSPIEAGLGWITKFVAGNDFINRSAFEQQKQNGVKRRLKGFVLEERGIPRHDYDIVDSDGEVIGKVTSGTMSPVLKKGIGMGYVNSEYWKPGSEIFIRVRKRDLKARIVKPPFI